MENKRVYLIPGRQSRVDGKLGNFIIELGFDVIGRNVKELEKFRFSEQLEIIKNDIKKYFWSKDSKIVAQSYGGYLIMHTLIEFLPEEYPGKVLLLSPVLGKSKAGDFLFVSRPPRAKKILEYAKEGKLKNLNIETHTGKEDNGCDYRLAQAVFEHIDNKKIVILENTPHDLPDEYTKKVLKSFLEGE